MLRLQFHVAAFEEVRAERSEHPAERRNGTSRSARNAAAAAGPAQKNIQVFGTAGSEVRPAENHGSSRLHRILNQTDLISSRTGSGSDPVFCRFQGETEYSEQIGKTKTCERETIRTKETTRRSESEVKRRGAERPDVLLVSMDLKFLSAGFHFYYGE